MSHILVIVEGEVAEPKYFRQFQEFHRELFSQRGNQSEMIIQSFPVYEVKEGKGSQT